MQGLIYALDILVVIVVFFGIWIGLRWKYTHDIGPTKDWPHGKIVAEFWTTHGARPRELVGIEQNGIEIKAPHGHKTPRYYFNKAAVGWTKYPSRPLIPLPGVEVDAQIVTWYQDSPEPIPATAPAARIGGKVVTSELLDLTKDTETLALAQAVNEELAKQQKQIAEALSGRLDKRVVYIGLVVCALVAILAAVFAYQAYQGIKAFTGEALPPLASWLFTALLGVLGSA